MKGKQKGTIMTQKERMINGLLYNPNDKDIITEQAKCLELLYDFNQTKPSELAKRVEILKSLLGSIGDNCYIEPPLRTNWGKNTHFGDGVYANFNLTLVDDADIFIGDNVMFGPNVTIATASHPIDPVLRKKGYQYNMPVYIGNNVWIGAGAIIMRGLKIGENSIIGAGSVVTKDIPPNVIAVGNPCRIMRNISENDKVYYYHDKKIDWENL